jgi:hypothetical protein
MIVTDCRGYYRDGKHKSMFYHREAALSHRVPIGGSKWSAALREEDYGVEDIEFWTQQKEKNTMLRR